MIIFLLGVLSTQICSTCLSVSIYVNICTFVCIKLYRFLYMSVYTYKNTQLHKNLQLGILLHQLILLQITPTHFLKIFHSWHTITPSNTTPTLIPGNFKIHTDDPPNTLASHFLEFHPSNICNLDPPQLFTPTAQFLYVGYPLLHNKPL